MPAIGTYAWEMIPDSLEDPGVTISLHTEPRPAAPPLARSGLYDQVNGLLQRLGPFGVSYDDDQDLYVYPLRGGAWRLEAERMAPGRWKVIAWEGPVETAAIVARDEIIGDLMMAACLVLYRRHPFSWAEHDAMHRSDYCVSPLPTESRICPVCTDPHEAYHARTGRPTPDVRCPLCQREADTA